jgi:glucose-1-phosphate thymidylyltransferase
MDQLKEAGINDVGVIIAPETGRQIKESLNENPWKHHFTFILQEKPLGLAHTVKISRRYLGESSFIMYLGDNLIGESICSFVNIFLEEKPDALILLKKVDNPSSFGVAVIDTYGKVKKLIEKPQKPPSNLALVGVYIFTPIIHEIINILKPSWRGEYEITDAIQGLLEKGKNVTAKILQSWWLDTGKKDDLLEANTIVLDEFLKTDIKGKIGENTRISGRVKIEETVRVENSTIKGPVIIGKNTYIESSYIGPYTSIGNNVKIIDSVIQNSVILDFAEIKKIDRLEDSLIGRYAKLQKKESSFRAYRVSIGDYSEIEF